MKMLKEYLEKSKRSILGPTSFFESAKPEDNWKYSLKFASISALIPSILLGLLAFTGNISNLSEAFLGLAVVSAFFFALPMFFFIIQSFVTHIFVALLGEGSFNKTLEVLAYPSFLTISLGWIPVVNIIVGLYSVYVEAKGLENFQEISFGKSILAVLLARLTAWIAVFAVLFMTAIILGGILASLGFTPPPSTAA